MELTPENKAYIDAMSLEGLLAKWRHAKVGDPWMAGDTGEYWGNCMAELRDAPGGNIEWVEASKSIGWD